MTHSQTTFNTFVLIRGEGVESLDQRWWPPDASDFALPANRCFPRRVSAANPAIGNKGLPCRPRPMDGSRRGQWMVQVTISLSPSAPILERGTQKQAGPLPRAKR